MSVLQAAGNSLLTGSVGTKPPLSPLPRAALGVRSLREDYLKPTHRAELVRNLELISERLESHAKLHGPLASAERQELPRFRHLFEGGALLPPGVFVAALELGASEQLNGRQLPFDADVLILRDNLVVAYKPLVAKIRQLHAKEVEDIPQRAVLNFGRAWTAWEAAWLRNCEVHAVEALQPLAKAILSLEPLLNSVEKERLLPWPRVQHQKAVTLKCLQGFMHSFNELAATVLPSLQRELDHDPRLLLLMEHVLSLRGDASVQSCLDGLSAAPEVSFPDHQVNSVPPQQRTSSHSIGSLTLDAYAFKLFGASVGDAVATGRLRTDSGTGQAGRAKLAQCTGSLGTVVNIPRGMPFDASKETDMSKKAAEHAVELLVAFESVKDLLLSLKSTLEYVDPALDHDEEFVSRLQRFERAFRRSKRLFLEPDNLA